MVWNKDNKFDERIDKIKILMRTLNKLYQVLNYKFNLTTVSKSSSKMNSYSLCFKEFNINILLGK